MTRRPAASAFGTSLGDSSSGVGGWTLPLVAGFLLALAASVASQRWAAAVLVAAVPAVLAVLIADSTMVGARTRASRVLPALIAALPLFRWVSPGVGGAYVNGATLLAIAPWILVALYGGLTGGVGRAGVRIRFRPLMLPVVGLTACMAISQLAAGQLFSPSVQLLNGSSLYFLVGMVGYALLACVYCDSPQRVESIMWWCLAINLVQVATVFEQKLLPASRGPVQVLFGAAPAQGGVYGLLGDGELTSELLVLLFTWALCFLLWGSSGRGRLLAALMSLAYLGAIVSMTYRAALLGAIATSCLVLAVALLRPGRRRHWSGAVVLVTGVAFLFAASADVRGLSDAVVTRINDTSVLELGTQGSAGANRGGIYAAGLRAASHMPASGYGTDAVQAESRELGYDVISLHSIWLWALLGSGVGGLIFMVLLFARALACATRAWLASRSGTSVALLVSVAFLIVDQSKIDAVRVPVYALFFFSVLGMVASYSQAFRVGRRRAPGTP